MFLLKLGFYPYTFSYHFTTYILIYNMLFSISYYKIFDLFQKYPFFHIFPLPVSKTWLFTDFCLVWKIHFLNLLWEALFFEINRFNDFFITFLSSSQFFYKKFCFAQKLKPIKAVLLRILAFTWGYQNMLPDLIIPYFKIFTLFLRDSNVPRTNNQCEKIFNKTYPSSASTKQN